MTDTTPTAVALPDRIGQATIVEQSRAVAEVQGAILVAQRCPRDVPTAVAAMRDSCAQQHLAERAFFRFPRSGSTVTGPSVYLARELARCWGNVQYGVSEMRRDDGHGQSEMLAFAWDVQTNTRVETKFVVPHMRDKRGGPERLTDMRDIYENNANAGARRVRECVFSILPPWYVEEAKELCSRTLTDGGGKSLQQRVADAIKAYEGIGVSSDQLAARLGRAAGKWNEHDIAQLIVVYKSLERGEIRIEDEFPPDTVTADEIMQQAPEPVTPAEPASSAATGGITTVQQKKLHAVLGQCKVADRDARLEILATLVQHPITTSSVLTRDEATTVIDMLERVATNENPPQALDLLLAQLTETAKDGA